MPKKKKTNRQRRKHNRNLSTYALSDFMGMLKYKSGWYETRISAIDRFFPSSKTCSVCGYVMDSMDLNVRYWTCPKCGTHHQRDINAAKCIDKESIRII